MGALNITKVFVGGRLTRDPELKSTSSGVPFCTFTVAVNHKTSNGESKADFIECVAWRQTAEFITKFFHRASSILVEGSLAQRSWEDRETGKKRSSLEVLAETVYFVDPKNDSPSYGDTAPAYVPDAYTTPSTSSSAPTFEEVDPNDPMLPF